MRTLTIDKASSLHQKAYLANGLIGLRVGTNPILRGSCLVNGFCGLSPEKNTEEYADAPYPLGLDLQIQGIWLSSRPDLVCFRGQEYDLSCGELRTRFTVAIEGGEIRAEVVSFCCRYMPTIVLQECTITATTACELTVQANIDPRNIQGELRQIFWPGWEHRLQPHRDRDAVLKWQSTGGLCRLGLAYSTEFCTDGRYERRRNNYAHERDMALTNYHFSAVAGQSYTLRQYSALVPSTMHEEPHWQAAREVGVAVTQGFGRLRRENRDAWAELWKGCPRITASESKWQEIAEAAFFYLHSSVHAATPCSVAPFGLSQRSLYSGHVFWDTETFMFPPTLLSAPDAARAILDYRSQRLEAARNNARLGGYRGLQFPWQSSISGCEVTPYYTGACGGVTEQHINMDVAFAFAQYAAVSGDDIFIREQAWPVLKGVAEWICSRVKQTARGYEILNVTGIDEGIDNINNNSYTNIAAIVALREAANIARYLGVKPPQIWQEVEKGIFLPIDPQSKVMLKHDNYRYTGGPCCPETMAGYFPLNYKHSPETDRATARYHIELAHTYMGMPMLSALYAVWACREGERTLGKQFFEQGVETHLVEPYHQFNEVSRIAPKDNFLGSNNDMTVFLTNPAGYLMSIMYGLPGLQPDLGDPKGWIKEKAALPEGWEMLEIPRFFARGQSWTLTARHGQMADIRPQN